MQERVINNKIDYKNVNSAAQIKAADNDLSNTIRDDCQNYINTVLSYFLCSPFLHVI